MSWLMPPSTDDPADTLRWVRKIYIAMIPVGALVAALLLADHVGAWWLGLVPAALSILGLATIGRSIQRAEAHGPNDPATRPARVRRAERITLAWFSAFTVVVVAVSLFAEGVGLAVTMAVFMSVSCAAGIWLSRRWTRR
jgi:hypothetical protein